MKGSLACDHPGCHCSDDSPSPRRIGYIKDVILARSLDDAVFAALSSMVMLNNVEVVSCLTEDPVFLPELFARLRKVSPAEPQWRELVAFLQVGFSPVLFDRCSLFL